MEIPSNTTWSWMSCKPIVGNPMLNFNPHDGTFCSLNVDALGH
jgi:hypothetical protein